MLGSLYYGTLHRAGITTLARRLRAGALVLCYHNVVADRTGASFGEPGLHLSREQFARQAHWLKDHYTVVSLRELVSRLETGRSVRGLAAITFDDGYTGALTIAWPLLRSLSLPATMFIVADASSSPSPAMYWWDHPAVVHESTVVARDRRLLALGGDRGLVLTDAGASAAAAIPGTHLPADWSVIAHAATHGLEIGAHTWTHRTVTTLSDAELRHELAAPRDLIERWTGVRPDLFSYPYGIWDERVRDAVRAAGYRAAVTLDYGLNPAGTDPTALRRVNVPAGISAPAFAGWTAGIRPRAASDA